MHELTKSESEADLSELAVTYRGVVYPWQCDHIGHMNVMWYVGKFDEATWHLFALMGITPTYMRDQKRGMAAVEQTITYKRELRAGDVIAIRSGLLEMKERVIRFHHEMWNEETGDVVATTILTGVHMDTEERKSCPFPPEILERGRKMVGEHGLNGFRATST
ncbi:MAG: thioesterase family protein [Bacteroidota bacterium]